MRKVPIVTRETLTRRLVSLLSGINTSTSAEPIRLPSRKIQGRALKKARASERLKMYSTSLTSTSSRVMDKYGST